MGFEDFQKGLINKQEAFTPDIPGGSFNAAVGNVPEPSA